MTSATVTSKGQITIPAEVRAHLHLRPGTRLSFIPTDDGYEIRPHTASVRDLKGSVPPPDAPVGIDDMNEAIAVEAAARAEEAR